MHPEFYSLHRKRGNECRIKKFRGKLTFIVMVENFAVCLRADSYLLPTGSL